MDIRKEYIMSSEYYEKYLNKIKESEEEMFTHEWNHLCDLFPVDIAIDTYECYKLFDHPLWIYFNNNYNKDNCDWIPLIVTDSECYIPLPYSIKLNIAYYTEII